MISLGLQTRIQHRLPADNVQTSYIVDEFWKPTPEAGVMAEKQGNGAKY